MKHKQHTFPRSFLHPLVPFPHLFWAWWVWAPARRSPAAERRGQSGCRREIQSRLLSRKAWFPPWGLRVGHGGGMRRSCRFIVSLRQKKTTFGSFSIQQSGASALYFQYLSLKVPTYHISSTHHAASVSGYTFSTNGIWGSHPVSCNPNRNKK